MTASQQFFPEPEGRQLEFKEILLKYDSICRTTAAFSNDIGGIIIIGIRDKSREIIGLSEDLVAKYLEEVPRAIYDAVAPLCIPLVRTRLFGQKTVVEIEVFPGDQPPYFIKADGVNKGVYVRIGAHTKRATQEHLKELLRIQSRHSFDEETLSLDWKKSFKKEALAAFYGTSNFSDAQLLVDQVIKREVVTRRLLPTVSGIVFFGKNPSSSIPGAEVLMTRFVGTTPSEIITTEDFQGPLEEVSASTTALLTQWLSSKVERRGVRVTVTESDIPQEVLREAVLNALLHRKYSLMAPVKISVFSDRVEIFSPGNFPGPISPDQFEEGITYMRNPLLLQLARKRGLVEKRGLGLRIIFQKSRLHGNPRPLLIDGDDWVKLTLYRDRIAAPLSTLPEDTDDAIKRMKGTPLTTGIVASMLGVSRGTALAKLEKLCHQKVLVRRGKGRGSRYEWQ